MNAHNTKVSFMNIDTSVCLSVCMSVCPFQFFEFRNLSYYKIP